MKQIKDLFLFILQSAIYVLAIFLSGCLFFGAMVSWAIFSIVVTGWEWVFSKVKNAR